MRSSSPSAVRGFTLVELMVTVAVLAVVIAMAGPSMSEFTANNHVVTAKSTFAASVALARTEAARRGQNVIVQAIGDGAVGNEFAAGWELYVDADGNGAVGAGDTLLRRFDPPSDRVHLGGTTPLSFLPTGYLAGGAALDYKVCRASGSSAGYTISVTPSGIADVRTSDDC